MSFGCVFLNDYDSVQSKTVSVMAAALFITLTGLLSSPCLIRLTGLTLVSTPRRWYLWTVPSQVLPSTFETGKISFFSFLF